MQNQLFWQDVLEKGYYDKLFHIARIKNRGFQPAWEYFTLKHISLLLTKSKRHLDYACGSGTLLSILNSKNNVGIDIAAKQIEYAKEKYADFADFYTLPTDGYKELQFEKFETISCLGLIEFLDKEEIINLLNFFYNNLQKTGMVILTTPNFTFIFRLLLKLSNFLRGFSYDTIHITQVNNLKMLEILKYSNFEEIKIKNIITPAIFLSIFNIQLSFKLELLLNKVLKNRFGFIQIIELKKL